MQPEDIEGKWTDNKGNYYNVRSGWIYLNSNRRDLTIQKHGKDGVFFWNVKDEGDHWAFIFKKKKWILKKALPKSFVWVCEDRNELGKELRFYKFPEVIQGQWECGRQIIDVRDGEAIFRPNGWLRLSKRIRRNRGDQGQKFGLRDGGSVWKMRMGQEVWILNKEEAMKKTSTAISWSSTFSGETMKWLRRPTDDHTVADWGAYLKKQTDGKFWEQADMSAYQQGVEIVITDRNPLWKKWAWTKGHIITRKGQNVVVRMSALGKVLEVHPRDIKLVHQAQRMLDQREKVEAEARALKKRRYDLLQGKWCNSDGLHIEVKDKYATFLHSNTPYRIIFEAEPPVLMIGKVEWELRLSDDENKVFWTDFKRKIEWFRYNLAQPEQAAQVTPGVVPKFDPKPASAPPKYEELSKTPPKRVIPKSIQDAPPSYDEAVPPSYEQVTSTADKPKKSFLRQLFSRS